jgi:FtsZ-binding cell division protein ZapB
MLTLEQIKLLESKIARAIGFVNQVTEENGRLKKRNEALEEAVVRLKEEKARVEEGIVSVLGRLNQFEDVIGRSLTAVKAAPAAKSAGAAAVPAAAAGSAPAAAAVPVTAAAPAGFAPAAGSVPEGPAAQPAPEAASPKPAVPSVFTVDEESGPEDVSGPGPQDEELIDEDNSGEAELDIF